MTQLFLEDGQMVPATVIQAGPCWVFQKREKGKDGYDGVQLGFQAVKERKATRAAVGHAKKASAAPVRYLREIRDAAPAEYELGQEVRVDVFRAGDLVNVIGTTKGKGYQGVMKRCGFKGGAATHGSMFHRAPGSIGSSSYPSRVFKGMGMAGRMGHDRKTVKNLKVLRVDRERNLLLVKGAVPGSPSELLVIVNPKGQKQAAK
jgi:large subunit ribosomal protein L3